MASAPHPFSIFEGGRLKPGIYKIQNVRSETYLDIHLHSMEVCCRPADKLEAGRGLWGIKSLGGGYAVWRIDPGKPAQFCSPMKELCHNAPLSVTAYPVAWRIEVTGDTKYCGFEYVHFLWGPSGPSDNQTWDLWGSGSKDNGTPVKFAGLYGSAHQIWRLVPMETEGTITSSQLSYEMLDLGHALAYKDIPTKQPSGETRNVGSEFDDFGTVVVEVTTVTTRKKYRVEGS